MQFRNSYVNLKGLYRKFDDTMTKSTNGTMTKSTIIVCRFSKKEKRKRLFSRELEA
jgi:hypothetical protein